MPRLKHGLGYGKEEGFNAELDIWDQFDKEEKAEAEAKPAKGKEKVEPKKKALWETFVREGEGYLYARKVEPIAMAGRVVSGFEIFSEFVNGLKVEATKEVPIEELITGPGSNKGHRHHGAEGSWRS